MESAQKLGETSLHGASPPAGPASDHSWLNTPSQSLRHHIQVGFNISPANHSFMTDGPSSSLKLDLLMKSTSFNSQRQGTPNSGGVASLLSHQLRKMQARQAAQGQSQQDRPVCRNSKSNVSLVSIGDSKTFKKRSHSNPYSLIAHGQIDFPEHGPGLYDTRDLYGLKFDPIGESGVLSAEEIAAMVTEPFPPAVGSFPIMIDRKFK